MLRAVYTTIGLSKWLNCLENCCVAVRRYYGYYYYYYYYARRVLCASSVVGRIGHVIPEVYSVHVGYSRQRDMAQRV